MASVIELNGDKYLKADRKVKTVPAVITSKLKVNHVSKGKVTVCIDDEPGMSFELDVGSSGEFVFQRMADVECLVS